MKFISMALLLAMNAYAIEITEESLLEYAKKSSPNLDEIESKLLKAQSDYAQVMDGLGTSVYTGYNHTSTQERAVNPFFPVYSPINQYQAGVIKPTKYGVKAELAVSVDQRSGSSEQQVFEDIHTTIYGLTLTMDLWKDLFGKVTQRKIENAKVAYKSAQLQREVEQKTYSVAVRRIYWALVANNEKKKISESLLEASIAQTNDAKKRLKANISDKGEVARYEAQVAQRKGSLLLLRYEREALLKQLKDLVPSLNGKEIALGSYNLDQALGEVLSCAALIQTKKDAPMDFTKYDEVANLLKEVQKNQTTIDSTYDDIDISLSTTFKQTGLGSDQEGTDRFEGSFQKSLDDISDNDRSGFEAALLVTVPLGKKASNTEDVIKEYNKKRLAAQIESTQNNISTTHRQISESIKILGDVIGVQKVNSEQLKIRVADMRKKYNQARIQVNDLIQDQDALFSSDLSIVDTKLNVLSTLLDYFAVFTETPCSFNRI